MKEYDIWFWVTLIITLLFMGVLAILKDSSVDENHLPNSSLSINSDFSAYEYLTINPEMMNISPQIIINKEVCWEVTCNCAKNTSTPCLAYCFECKEGIL